MASKQQRERVFNKLFRLQAYHEIQNLMGRCTVALNHRLPQQVLSCFHLENDTVSLEVADEGLYVGAQSVTKCIEMLIPSQRVPGEMLDIQLTSPIIEVADDLQSARAQWVCPGIGAIPCEDTDPKAIWNWGILGVDFAYTGGIWKILHLHWFRLIKCSYEDGWVRNVSMESRSSPVTDLGAQPTTYHNPYSPTAIRSCIPAIPRPYRDASENPNWMLDEDKSK